MEEPAAQWFLRRRPGPQGGWTGEWTVPRMSVVKVSSTLRGERVEIVQQGLENMDVSLSVILYVAVCMCLLEEREVPSWRALLHWAPA